MSWSFSTAWCSEMGSLRSPDAPKLQASSDVREPISLHQAVYYCSSNQASSFWHWTLEVSLQPTHLQTRQNVFFVAPDIPSLLAQIRCILIFARGTYLSFISTQDHNLMQSFYPIISTGQCHCVDCLRQAFSLSGPESVSARQCHSHARNTR